MPVLERFLCNFCNDPIALFTLVVTTFKCFSKFNLASKNLIWGLRDNSIIKT